MIESAEILWKLVEHLTLTAAPAVAVGLLAVRRGIRSVPLILTMALAASGLVAILAFWGFYASPTIGKVWTLVVLFGSIEAIVWASWGGGLERGTLRALRTPLLLWAFATGFVVFLGFLHGGADAALHTASSRFSGGLPSDSDIPQYYSNWFYVHGHHGTPPLFPGEWHMSDRPPLQIGYVLSQRSLDWDAKTLHYEILGVVIQQLWIVGMWAVLTAARLRPYTRALALFAAMVSDVAIVHGFFVWPKLIAAAFLLGATALVVAPEWKSWRRDVRVAALFACLCGPAMLAHGSSVFGIIPLLIFAALRGMPSWRWLGVAVTVAAVLLGSWSAYQRYADPPGDRLLKWQLGGVTEIDERGALETIGDSYREAGIGGAVDAKWDNFVAMSGLDGGPERVEQALDAVGKGELDEALALLRDPRFFSLLAVLGILLIAPLAMLLARDRGRRRTAEWRFALFCFAFVVVGCLAWGLLLFGSPNAVAYLHVGSLAIPLLAICGCVAGLCSISFRLALPIVTLNALGVLVVYTPALTPLPGTEYSPSAALLAATSLVGFALVAFYQGDLGAGDLDVEVLQRDDTSTFGVLTS